MPDDKIKKEVRKCECCDKPIPKARLTALPNTTYCVGCQEEYELEHGIYTPIDLSDYDSEELLDAITPDSDD